MLLAKIFQKSILEVRRLPLYNFASYFRERDHHELKLIESEKDHNWKYLKLRDQWKKRLEAKRLRKQRIRLIKQKTEPTPAEDEKIVIHSPVHGIELPLNPEQAFAILKIGGSQQKVTKDDLVISEWLKNYDINDQIVFDQIMLIGTQYYSAIGRPFLQSAKVYATVEQQTLTEKVIVFKKKRRKGYKRNQGARQHITVLRINNIEHNINQDSLKKAVSLI